MASGICNLFGWAWGETPIQKDRISNVKVTKEYLPNGKVKIHFQEEIDLEGSNPLGGGKISIAWKEREHHPLNSYCPIDEIEGNIIRKTGEGEERVALQPMKYTIKKGYSHGESTYTYVEVPIGKGEECAPQLWESKGIKGEATTTVDLTIICDTEAVSGINIVFEDGTMANGKAISILADLGSMAFSAGKAGEALDKAGEAVHA
jgi:hypothetical protein